MVQIQTFIMYKKEEVVIIAKPVIFHELGRLSSLSLQINSIIFKASHISNSLPKFIRNSSISSCSVIVFRSRLANFISDVPNNPW